MQFCSQIGQPTQEMFKRPRARPVCYTKHFGIYYNLFVHELHIKIESKRKIYLAYSKSTTEKVTKCNGLVRGIFKHEATLHMIILLDSSCPGNIRASKIFEAWWFTVQEGPQKSEQTKRKWTTNKHLYQCSVVWCHHRSVVWCHHRNNRLFFSTIRGLPMWSSSGKHLITTTTKLKNLQSGHWFLPISTTKKYITSLASSILRKVYASMFWGSESDLP